MLFIFNKERDMKKIKLLLLISSVTLMFTACSSKTESAVLDSSKEDISQLLNKLIEKEKEIIDLTRQLENCKKQCNQ